MQGNVISSEYTVNEYIHNVPRQKLKKIAYLMHQQNF